MDIKFYGKFTLNTIEELIRYYDTHTNNLKEIIICMNNNKYHDKVDNIPWLYEIGDIIYQKYHISVIHIDFVKVYLLLSRTIPYDYIKSYPIYA